MFFSLDSKCGRKIILIFVLAFFKGTSLNLTPNSAQIQTARMNRNQENGQLIVRKYIYWLTLYCGLCGSSSCILDLITSIGIHAIHDSAPTIKNFFKKNFFFNINCKKGQQFSSLSQRSHFKLEKSNIMIKNKVHVYVMR